MQKRKDEVIFMDKPLTCPTGILSHKGRGERHKGFTLIELLVVVLIIGILAAVAVPQYEKAVAKSRTATVLPILADLVKAQEVYYLANGKYADRYEDLDIDNTHGCTFVEGNANDMNLPFKCGKYFLVDWAKTSYVALASYCPDYNDSYENCKNNRQFQIGLATEQTPTTNWAKPHVFRCIIQNSSTFGERICASLGKLVEENGKKRWEW